MLPGNNPSSWYIVPKMYDIENPDLQFDEPPYKLKSINYKTKFGRDGEPVGVIFVNDIDNQRHDANPIEISDN